MIGLLTVASLPSFIVFVVLGAVGVAFSTAGIAVFVAGVAELVRPGTVPGLTGPPWLCLLIGPGLVAVGAAALWVLYRYVRSLVRLTVRTLERLREPRSV